MGARTRTRAKLNVRPRSLVVNATGTIQKNNTPVDPKPRTQRTGNHANLQCSQLSRTHAIELATLQRSLLNAVSHLLSPTSLFLSVLLHVFALSSSLGLNFLLNAFPLSSSSTLPLSSFLTFISSALPSKQKTISILNSSCLFLFFLLSSLYIQWLSPPLSLPLGYSSLFLSFLFLPLASTSSFPNIADASGLRNLVLGAGRAAWTRHWTSRRVRPCVRSNCFV